MLADAYKIAFNLKLTKPAYPDEKQAFNLYSKSLNLCKSIDRSHPAHIKSKISNIICALKDYATYTQQLATSKLNYDADMAKAIHNGECRIEYGVKTWYKTYSHNYKSAIEKEHRNMVDLNATVYETIDIIYKLTDK